jgi:hypothetical protein
MPTFTAPISSTRHPSGRAYALSVQAPQLEVDVSPPLMTAYIVPDLPCCISEGLAQQYDPGIKEGEFLFLVMVERTGAGAIHEYSLAFPVTFARTARPDYVQIGVDHILLMFDVVEYIPRVDESPEARMLILRLRRCVRHLADPDGGEESVPV